MEETCSGGGGGGGCTEESNAVVCESTSRAARRRRMEIRRLRLVAGVEAAALTEESSPKRQRLDCSTNSPEFQGGKDPANGTVEEWMARDDAVASDSSSSSRLITDPELQAPPVELSDSGHFQRYGMTSIRGRRRDMEDAVSILPDLIRHGCGAPETYHFFGVYDGHGCSHVAVLCKDRMHELVAEEMERLESGRPTVEEWKKVMKRSFSQMDAEVAGWYRGDRTPSCRCVRQMPLCNNVGSTAVVSVVGTDQIVVANCGDSRAVLCRRGEAVPLSCDHKPDRPDELRRIQAAGGRVIYWDGARVLGVLAMSRAIGDGYLKPFVVSEPEVTVTERTEEDECLILASDGLWDVVTNEMACYIVRMCLRCNERPAGAGYGDHLRMGGEDDGAWRSGSDKACSDAALLLTKLALARRSSDNVSVVVTDLRRN